MITDEFRTQRLSYSVAEACKLTSLGKTVIYKLIASGRLETKKIGRRTLITASSLWALLENEEAGQ